MSLLLAEDGLLELVGRVLRGVAPLLIFVVPLLAGANRKKDEAARRPRARRRPARDPEPQPVEVLGEEDEILERWNELKRSRGVEKEAAAAPKPTARVEPRRAAPEPLAPASPGSSLPIFEPSSLGRADGPGFSSFPERAPRGGGSTKERLKRRFAAERSERRASSRSAARRPGLRDWRRAILVREILGTPRGLSDEADLPGLR